MRNMAPMCREKQLKDKYKFDKVDYAQILYRTRMITLIDTYWMAWSEDDKAEDYHPLFNKSLMEQRFEGQIQIDPEEEDNVPFPPYAKITSGDMFETVNKLPYFEFEE